MAIDFREVINNLIDIGFYEIFLPFILIYAVVFAVLEKSRIFEKEENDRNSRSVNSVIAFVFGLFTVASLQTVQYIQSVIVNIVVFLIFLLVTMIALGFVFGKDYFKHMFENKDGTTNKGLIWTVGGIILIVSVSVLFSVIGFWDWLEDTSRFNITGDDIWTVIVIILFVVVLAWITNGGNSSNSHHKKDNLE